MRTTLLGVLIATCAFAQNPRPAACGPAGTKFKVSKDKSQHPTPAVASSKAMVYILGEGAAPIRFGLDGKWVGEVDDSYSFLELDPGEHHLCAELRMRTPLFLPVIKVDLLSAHSLNTEPGETYYFYAYNDPRAATLTLRRLDPDEGARMVSSTSFGTSHPK